MTPSSRSEESSARAALAAGDAAEPQATLGVQPAGPSRWRVRVWHPDASAAEILPAKGGAHACAPTDTPGLFETIVRGSEAPRYRVRFRFPDGSAWEAEDPYRFPVSVGEVDLYLFAEGTHRALWKVLGAHPQTLDGIEGVRLDPPSRSRFRPGRSNDAPLYPASQQT